ncbi:EF-P beta-lysylation protein EpmB [Chromatium okenii]|uniref:EF-P beta-lysylation protein EpmB n=1 Tax=Chromatium okenii TaxID=61644 RepID=UPI003B83082B
MVTRSLLEIPPAPPLVKGNGGDSAITAVTELLAALELKPADIPDLDPDPSPFCLLVPREFVALMQPGNPHDPLLRQILPLRSEERRVAGYVTDPVNDTAALHAPGLLHKYNGRALLLTTAACALHCRYCFRRHLQPATLGMSTRHHALAIAQIAQDSSLTEVILSGGEPLLLDDAQLEILLAQLAAIPHLRRVRIHTRLPTLLPTRITPQLCAMLSNSRLTPALVLHVNHAQELGSAAAAALQKLRHAGIAVFNQSVLLRGVNDDCAVLAQLSERLFECGAVPYYLHQLDPVAGAAHFQVSDVTARQLLERLRAQLPGYLVPRLVREIPGAAAKYPL